MENACISSFQSLRRTTQFIILRDTVTQTRGVFVLGSPGPRAPSEALGTAGIVKLMVLSFRLRQIRG